MRNLSALSIAILALVGCDARYAPPPQVTYTTPGPSYAAPPPPQPQVPQYKADMRDFDLQTVSSMLRTNQVTDARTLEQLINGDGQGINNLDIDHDGNRDYVGIKEIQSGQNRTFQFLAFPSSQGQQAEPIVIANIDFTFAGSQVTVQAGYANCISGYDTNYYTYNVQVGPGLGQMLFYSWLLAPRPVYLYRPYASIGWVPHPVFAPTTLATTRTTYRTQTRMSPVPVSTPPSSFKTDYSPQVKSRFAPSTPAPSSTRLSDRAGRQDDFTVRSPDRPKTIGSAFGAGSPRPTTMTSPPPSRPSPAPSPSFSLSGNRGGGFSRPAPSPPASRPSLGSSSGSRGGGFGGKR